jgi:hypothetical protein
MGLAWCSGPQHDGPTGSACREQLRETHEEGARVRPRVNGTTLIQAAKRHSRVGDGCYAALIFVFQMLEADANQGKERTRENKHRHKRRHRHDRPAHHNRFSNTDGAHHVPQVADRREARRHDPARTVRSASSSCACVYQSRVAARTARPLPASSPERRSISDFGHRRRGKQVLPPNRYVSFGFAARTFRTASRASSMRLKSPRQAALSTGFSCIALLRLAVAISALPR